MGHSIGVFSRWETGEHNRCQWRYDEAGRRIDNITDWALKQFKDHYKSAAHVATGDNPSSSSSRRRPGSSSSASAIEQELEDQPSPLKSASCLRRNDEQKRKQEKSAARPITKQAIFHYVYAVLHDPLYREKYAQNLKREFPRVPFYADFWRWSDWGTELMALHIGYETVEPWPLERIDTPDTKARTNGAAPKAMLKADRNNGRIVLDSETALTGIPPDAWDYKLGNRSALEWILDQYREKKPKDPTIRERFNTYRFADYKEKVIDLLARVTRVSVDTQRVVSEMRQTSR